MSMHPAAFIFSSPYPATSPPNNTSSLSTSAPSGSTSLSRPGTPVRSDSQPVFDFPVPSVPPRLKNIGRRISQMSSEYLYDDMPASSSRPPSTEREPKESAAHVVPFMGDEPVMCPFCNKPLPPSLLAGHDHPPTTRGRASSEQPGELRRTTSMKAKIPERPHMSQKMSMTAIPVSQSSNTTPKSKSIDLPPLATPAARSVAKAPGQEPTKLLDSLPVTAAASEPPVPKATSESLASTVTSAERADSAAASLVISPDDIKRWSSMAGIALDSAPPPSQAASSPDRPNQSEVKPFPLLAPPPPPAPPNKLVGSRPGTERSNSGRFGFFGKKASQDTEGESSDDEGEGRAMGYARVGAGDGESDEEEKEDGEKKGQMSAIVHDEPEVIGQGEAKEETTTEDARSAEPATVSKEVEEVKAEKSGDDDEVKKVLREVLSKVNEVSQSHASLLHSHTVLLTSLKIARSNLAMAEANAEMLEDQLKRQNATPKPVTPASSRPGPSAGAIQAAAALAAAKSPTTPVSAPLPARSSSEAPRRSLDNNRPGRPALQLTAAQLANPTAQAQAQANSATSGGTFSGFWNGSRKKLAQQIASIPGSPVNERGEFDFHALIPPVPVPASHPYSVAQADRRSTEAARPRSDSLQRSASTTHLPTVTSPKASMGALPAPSQSEYAKMRTAYLQSMTRLDAMAKELAELKKGKVEMEAELENLSQALFEEANKMVADERRKRAEAEEGLKEVREEREVLRETVRVLGGDVPVRAGSSEVERKDTEDVKKVPSVKIDAGTGAAAAGGEEGGEGGKKVVDNDDNDEEEEGFMPRDLDKHYAALRKSIHHVAEGVTLDDEDEDEDNGTTAPVVPFGEAAAIGGMDEVMKMPPAAAPLPVFTEDNPWAAGTTGRTALGVPGMVETQPSPTTEERVVGEGGIGGLALRGLSGGVGVAAGEGGEDKN